MNKAKLNPVATYQFHQYYLTKISEEPLSKLFVKYQFFWLRVEAKSMRETGHLKNDLTFQIVRYAIFSSDAERVSSRELLSTVVCRISNNIISWKLLILNAYCMEQTMFAFDCMIDIRNEHPSSTNALFNHWILKPLKKNRSLKLLCTTRILALKLLFQIGSKIFEIVLRLWHFPERRFLAVFTHFHV